MPRIHRTFRTFLIPCTAALALVACDDDTPVSTPAPVASVAFEVPPATLVAGEAVQLRVRVLDTRGEPADVPVTWGSADPAVATVSTAGRVTALAAGETRLTASAGGRSTSTLLRVTAPVVPVATVTITTADPLVLRLGERSTLAAVVRDANGAVLGDRVVAWRVLDAQVVALQNGVEVVGFNPGQTRVIASVEGVEDTITVRVDPSAARVVADRDSLWLAAGGTDVVTAVALDPQGRPMSLPVTWTSSEPTVATVDAQGRVTALRTGRARLRARTQGVLDEVIVEVVPFAVTNAPWTAVSVGDDARTLPARLFTHVHDGGSSVNDLHAGRITFESGNRYRQVLQLFVTPVGQAGDFGTYVAEGRTMFDPGTQTIVFVPDGSASQFRGQFRADGTFHVRQFVLPQSTLAITTWRVVP